MTGSGMRAYGNTGNGSLVICPGPKLCPEIYYPRTSENWVINGAKMGSLNWVPCSVWCHGLQDRESIEDKTGPRCLLSCETRKPAERGHSFSSQQKRQLPLSGSFLKGDWNRVRTEAAGFRWVGGMSNGITEAMKTQNKAGMREIRDRGIGSEGQFGAGGRRGNPARI